ncbi:DUF1684 domain-containing protein [Marnyiella aurantia]|uniref:DUF1684 domain-containing protein n=1 Tax=Marnyiella aurantia TaxID=2758037 RepID=A0A7D7QED2_9FLAO|nr:DUF1684 domain-containing protein [Marnyiella aurantia]MBA5246559.1 DUF1684 domain-containing protein [Marnyiella aurantia]QMS98081.1 DUF1684 domain-containing protein [Marnyiella aurantia]
MKKLNLLLLLFSQFVFSQSVEEHAVEILKFQAELNREYRDVRETPLRGVNFKNFKEHPFFAVDLNYRIAAKFKRTENALPLEISTSSGHTKPYIEFGTATFAVDGKNFTLKIYQSVHLVQKPEYKNHLFLPFHDATNGKETYGGGRYLDLEILSGDTVILDFNKAYQPYCAYNAYDYSCPIVPAENTLPVAVKAGVRYEDVYFIH